MKLRNLLFTTIVAFCGAFPAIGSSDDNINAPLNFLRGIPEFSELNLRMTEADLGKIIDKHSIHIQSHSTENGRSSYVLHSVKGQIVVVSFTGGKCSGIQRLMDMPNLPENTSRERDSEPAGDFGDLK